MSADGHHDMSADGHVMETAIGKEPYFWVVIERWDCGQNFSIQRQFPRRPPLAGFESARMVLLQEEKAKLYFNELKNCPE